MVTGDSVSYSCYQPSPGKKKFGLMAIWTLWKPLWRVRKHSQPWFAVNVGIGSLGRSPSPVELKVDASHIEPESKHRRTHSILFTSFLISQPSLRLSVWESRVRPAWREMTINTFTAGLNCFNFYRQTRPTVTGSWNILMPGRRTMSPCIPKTRDGQPGMSRSSSMSKLRMSITRPEMKQSRTGVIQVWLVTWLLATTLKSRAWIPH